MARPKWRIHESSQSRRTAFPNRDAEQTTTKEDGKLTSENKAERQLNNSYTHPNCVYFTIGIKHGFSCINIRQVPWEVLKHGFQCINIRQVPWEVLKTAAFGLGFQHLPRDLAIVNALKNHVQSLLLHKKMKTFATFRVISCTILFSLFTDVSRT